MIQYSSHPISLKKSFIESKYFNTDSRVFNIYVGHNRSIFNYLKDVLHRSGQGARIPWCTCFSLFIWLVYTSKGTLRPSIPLKTWYCFSKLKEQLWVLKTEAALAPWLYIRLSQKITGVIFVIRASDVVLPIFDMLFRFCAIRGH